MRSRVERLRAELDDCQTRDRHRFKRELDRLAGSRESEVCEASWQRLSEAITRSRTQVAARSQRIPELIYPDLPVSDRRQEVIAALAAHQVVVVCGETGSGKTTQLPKICLEAGRGRHGLIGHTQPRRLAARTVASRIAEEMGSVSGEMVGYKIRFKDRTAPEGLIKLMTDGILLAEMQQDRFLQDYDTLIIDEAHERSLNIDFLLGYLKWLLPRRRDLKVVITSATIDPTRFSEHFGGAPIIEVSGRTFPVEVRYRPLELPEADETDRLELQAILDAVEELWRDLPGDILVFLSGEREIREATDFLQKHLPKTVEVLPLYARLSEQEQQKIFHPSNIRRIVLATNVAETSLTVPGIRSVIDSGLARISRYSHRSKLQRLPIERISQASANQRSGRCGRLGPGVAIRLYAEEDFLGREPFTDPEILRTNLAQVILQMRALKLGDIQNFPFIEPPDERLIRDGLRTLQELNALDSEARLTPIGQTLARLPMDPRLGRMLLAAREERCVREVAVIVAALSVPDPRERPPEKAQQADQQHGLFRDERSDFLFYLRLWEAYQAERSETTKAGLRSYCRRHYLSPLRMREWQDTHRQILEILERDLGWIVPAEPADSPEIHKALLAGLLGHVALRTDQGDYLGGRGNKLSIHPGSFLFKQRPKWIVSAEQVETTKVYARTVAAIQPEWIEQVGAHLVKRQYYDPTWERKVARGVIHERTVLFGLTVQSGRRVPYEQISPQEARILFIRHALVAMDYDTQAEFFLRNQTLLEEADYLQQKGRRIDLVEDEAWLEAFYDQKIPAEVVNGVSFERWRKLVESKDPQWLWLTAEMILRQADSVPSEMRFPDHAELGALRLALSYRFEPGHPEDGVSVRVPLQLLNGLESAPFRWLVPGLLPERIAALVKSLPKTLRIHFVPVPEVVERVLPMLDPGSGDLYEALSRALKKVGGIQVPVGAFREEVVPDHLKMNFLVLDAAQQVIDAGRDLTVLKHRHAIDAKQSFISLAQDIRLSSGLREWPLEKIPVILDESRAGQRMFGFPALVDETESVGIRLFETPQEAELHHEMGAARLCALTLGKELKSLQKVLRVSADMALRYERLASHPSVHAGLGRGRVLATDMSLRLLAATFLEGQPSLRDRLIWETRLGEKRADLYPTAERFGDVAVQLFATLKEIQPLLDGRLDAAVREDAKTQLQFLVYAGFWVRTPWSALREFPRYLSALECRLKKAAQDPQRDARLRSEIIPFQQAFWAEIDKARGSKIPEREAFRWSLEEFRVSLFAQHLKTAYPISAKRLAEALKAFHAGKPLEATATR